MSTSDAALVTEVLPVEVLDEQCESVFPEDIERAATFLAERAHGASPTEDDVRALAVEFAKDRRKLTTAELRIGEVEYVAKGSHEAWREAMATIDRLNRQMGQLQRLCEKMRAMLEQEGVKKLPA